VVRNRSCCRSGRGYPVLGRALHSPCRWRSYPRSGGRVCDRRSRRPRFRQVHQRVPPAMSCSWCLPVAAPSRAAGLRRYPGDRVSKAVIVVPSSNRSREMMMEANPPKCSQPQDRLREVAGRCRTRPVAYAVPGLQSHAVRQLSSSLCSAALR
jgi:hypothetical protein